MSSKPPTSNKEPRSSQNEEVVGFREDVKILDDCGDKVVDLGKRLRRIGRKAGMDIEATGSFPTIPAKQA
jgi:hypothetical protein